jgi:purine-binding chemotaxis protein CheW
MDNWNEEEDNQRYLLFRLGEELYGSPILGIREVVEPQEPKPIPNTVPYFLGVINIRGEIVGVIDLRIRFNHQVTRAQHNAMIVFETEAGPLAALVDKVEAVSQIADDAIEKKPNIKAAVEVEYLIGVSKGTERMATLIDLNRALSAEELRVIRSARV